MTNDQLIYALKKYSNVELAKKTSLNRRTLKKWRDGVPIKYLKYVQNTLLNEIKKGELNIIEVDSNRFLQDHPFIKQVTKYSSLAIAKASGYAYSTVSAWRRYAYPYDTTAINVAIQNALKNGTLDK